MQAKGVVEMRMFAQRIFDVPIVISALLLLNFHVDDALRLAIATDLLSEETVMHSLMKSDMARQ